MVNIPNESETLAAIEWLSEIVPNVDDMAADLREACEVYPHAEKLAADRERFSRAADAIWDAVELLEATVGTVPW